MSSSESYFCNVKFLFSPLWMCLLFYGQVSAVDWSDPTVRDKLSSGQYVLTFGLDGEDGTVKGGDNGNHKVKNENDSSGTGQKKTCGTTKLPFSIFGGSGWINGSLKGMEGARQIDNYPIPPIPLSGMEGGHEVLPIQITSGSSGGMKGSQIEPGYGINNMTFLVPAINGSRWVNGPLSGLNGSQQYMYHRFASSPWNGTEESPGKRILYFTSGPGSQGGLPQGPMNLTYLSSLFGASGFTNVPMQGIKGFQQIPTLVYNSSSLNGTSPLPTLVYTSGPFGGMQGSLQGPGTTNWTIPGIQIGGSGIQYLPLAGFNISQQFVHHQIVSHSWNGVDGNQGKPIIYFAPGPGSQGVPTNLSDLSSLLGQTWLANYLKSIQGTQQSPILVFNSTSLNGTSQLPNLVYTSGPYGGMQGSRQIPGTTNGIFPGYQIVGSGVPMQGFNISHQYIHHQFTSGSWYGMNGHQPYPIFYIIPGQGSPGRPTQERANLTTLKNLIGRNGCLKGLLKGRNLSEKYNYRQSPRSPLNGMKGNQGAPIILFAPGPGNQGGLPQGTINLTYLSSLLGTSGFINGAPQGLPGTQPLPIIQYTPGPFDGIKGSIQGPGTTNLVFNGSQITGSGFLNGPLKGMNGSRGSPNHQNPSSSCIGAKGGHGSPIFYYTSGPGSQGGLTQGITNLTYLRYLLGGYGFGNPLNGIHGAPQSPIPMYTGPFNGMGGFQIGPGATGVPIQGFNISQFIHHQTISNTIHGTTGGYVLPTFPFPSDSSGGMKGSHAGVVPGTSNMPFGVPTFNGYGWPNGLPTGLNISQQYLYHQFVSSLLNGKGGNAEIPILYYTSGPGNQGGPTLGTTNLMHLGSLFGEAWLFYYLKSIQETQQLPIIMFNSTSSNGTQQWPTLVYPSGPLDGIKGSLQGPGTTNWTFDGTNFTGSGFHNGPLKGLNGSLESPDHQNPSSPWKGAEGGHGSLNLYFTSSPGSEVNGNQGGTTNPSYFGSPLGGLGMNGSANLPYMMFDSNPAEATELPTLVISTDSGTIKDLQGMNGSEKLPYLTFDSTSPEGTTLPTFTIYTNSGTGTEERQNGPTGGTTDLTSLSSLTGGSGFGNESLKGIGGSQEYPTLELITDYAGEDEGSQGGKPGGIINITYFGSPFDGFGFVNGSLKGMNGSQELPTLQFTSGPFGGINGSREDIIEDIMLENNETASENTTDESTTSIPTSPATIPLAPTQPTAPSLPPTTSPTPLTPPPLANTSSTTTPSDTIPSATTSAAPTPSTSTPVATTISAISPSVLPLPITPSQPSITTPSTTTKSGATPATTTASTPTSLTTNPSFRNSSDLPPPTTPSQSGTPKVTVPSPTSKQSNTTSKTAIPSAPSPSITTKSGETPATTTPSNPTSLTTNTSVGGPSDHPPPMTPSQPKVTVPSPTPKLSDTTPTISTPSAPTPSTITKSGETPATTTPSSPTSLTTNTSVGGPSDFPSPTTPSQPKVTVPSPTPKLSDTTSKTPAPSAPTPSTTKSASTPATTTPPTSKPFTTNPSDRTPSNLPLPSPSTPSLPKIAVPIPPPKPSDTTPTISTPSATTPSTPPTPQSAMTSSSTTPSTPAPFTTPPSARTPLVPTLPMAPLQPTTTALNPTSPITFAQPLTISPVINLYPMLPPYARSYSYTCQYSWTNPCLWANQYPWTSQNKNIIPENTPEKSATPTPLVPTLPMAPLQPTTTASTSASSITSAQSLTVSPIVNVHPISPPWANPCSSTSHYSWGNPWSSISQYSWWNPCLSTSQYPWTTQNKNIIPENTPEKSATPTPLVPTLPTPHSQPLTTPPTSASSITSAQSLTVSPIVNVHPMSPPWANPCPSTSQYSGWNPFTSPNQYPWANPWSSINQFPWVNPCLSTNQYLWASQNKKIIPGNTTEKSATPTSQDLTLPTSQSQPPTTLSLPASSITSAQSLTGSPIVNVHPMSPPWANPCPSPNQYLWANPCLSPNPYPSANPCLSPNPYPSANPWSCISQFPWIRQYQCHFHNHMNQLPSQYPYPSPQSFPNSRTNEVMPPRKTPNPLDVIKKIIMLRQGSGTSNSTQKVSKCSASVVDSSSSEEEASTSSLSSSSLDEISCKACA